MVEIARDFLIPDEAESLSQYYVFSYLESLIYHENVDRVSIQKKGENRLKDPAFRSFNRWNLALFKRELAGIRQKMSVRPIDELKGAGLFANNTLFEMTCIGEYVGVVKKRDKKKDRDNSYIFEYAIDTLDTGYVIDAEKQGNHTRFINHSDNPNLLSRWLLIDNLPRIIFFTNRRVEKDEELTVDYGPYYWE
ncbi:MAG: SET domain-containing protein-lysine N-methyltransferase [Chlamydiia bacterium]|jgi:hypothetical protein